MYIYILEFWRFSSFQSFSHVWLFETPWTAARQASLSITNSRRLFKLMAIESVMPSNHLILCCPLLLPPSIFPIVRVFSNEPVQVSEVVNGSDRLRAKPWQRGTPLKLLGRMSPLSSPAFRDCLSSLVPGLLPAISITVTFAFVITSPSDSDPSAFLLGEPSWLYWVTQIIQDTLPPQVFWHNHFCKILLVLQGNTFTGLGD